MVVLTAETCWALNEYWINNKISGIKLVSLYSTIFKDVKYIFRWQVCPCVNRWSFILCMYCAHFWNESIQISIFFYFLYFNFSKLHRFDRIEWKYGKCKQRRFPKMLQRHNTIPEFSYMQIGEPQETWHDHQTNLQELKKVLCYRNLQYYRWKTLLGRWCSTLEFVWKYKEKS